MSQASSALDRRATRVVNRAQVVEENFDRFLENWTDEVEPVEDLTQPLNAKSSLTGIQLLTLLDSQMLARQLDLRARDLRARNQGFYTIGSAGHENNSVVGLLSKLTDPAILHYRSGPFVMARAKKLKELDIVYDIALSLTASSEDPISGGRHKVFGSKPLNIIPQTSTIASHLPKAVGLAIALEQKKRLKLDDTQSDAIVICSFGDASVNHATALSAFNAAEWASYQRLPVPVLFVCEDNGWGISVRTPDDWVARRFSERAGVRYFAADGRHVEAAFDATEAAMNYCRQSRSPTFLHLKTMRLLGHAGTDAEGEYRSIEEIERDEANDPLIQTAAAVLKRGLISADQLISRNDYYRSRVREAARKAAKRPKLRSAEQVMESLAPLDIKALEHEAARVIDKAEREAHFAALGLPEASQPKHLAIQINRALRDLMLKYPEMTVFGEDVAQKGGVYTVTSGLLKAFKNNRVFNTLLDETTILGLAQGAGLAGLLPVPEIQYLAYFHNACDQIRGEACSTQYFSKGQFQNPMVMRIAALGYQKGFGGHFHNDNSITALRDIPGLVVACPSRGDDAVMMLRTCMALAKQCGRVVAYLEPIALYMTKDLHESKDGKWLQSYPSPKQFVPLGEPRIYNPEAKDALIITFGNGVYQSLRVAKRVFELTQKKVRILDLRWLKPLNAKVIASHANDIGKVLVVDEGRRSGGISEEIFTLLDENAKRKVRKQRVVGEDCYIPLGPAADTILLQEAQIQEALTKLLSK